MFIIYIITLSNASIIRKLNSISKVTDKLPYSHREIKKTIVHKDDKLVRYDNTNDILKKYREIYEDDILNRDESFEKIDRILRKYSNHLNSLMTNCLNDEIPLDIINNSCLKVIKQFTQLLSWNNINKHIDRLDDIFSLNNILYYTDFSELRRESPKCFKQFDMKERPIDVYYLLLLPFSIGAIQCLNKFLSADFIEEIQEHFYFFNSSHLSVGLLKLVSLFGKSQPMRSGIAEPEMDIGEVKSEKFYWWRYGWGNFLQFISCVFFSTEISHLSPNLTYNLGSGEMTRLFQIIYKEHPYFSRLANIAYFSPNNIDYVNAYLQHIYHPESEDPFLLVKDNIQVNLTDMVSEKDALNFEFHIGIDAINVYSTDYGRFFYKNTLNLFSLGDDYNRHMGEHDESKEVESIIDDTLKMEDPHSDDSSIQSLVSSHNSADPNIPSELMAISQHFNISIEDVAEFIENEIISTFDFKLIVENFKEDLTSVDYINSFNKLCSNPNLANLFNFAKYIDAELCIDIRSSISSTYRKNHTDSPPRTGPAHRVSISLLNKSLKNKGFLLKLTTSVFLKLFRILKSLNKESLVSPLLKLKMISYFTHFLNMLFSQVTYSFTYYFHISWLSEGPFSTSIVILRYFEEFIVPIFNMIYNKYNGPIGSVMREERQSFYYIGENRKNQKIALPFILLSNFAISYSMLYTIKEIFTDVELPNITKIFDTILYSLRNSHDYEEFALNFQNDLTPLPKSKRKRVVHFFKKPHVPINHGIRLGILSKGILSEAFNSGLTSAPFDYFGYNFFYTSEDLIDFIPEEHLPIFLFRLLFRRIFPETTLIEDPLFYIEYGLNINFSIEPTQNQLYIEDYLLFWTKSVATCDILSHTLETIGSLQVSRGIPGRPIYEFTPLTIYKYLSLIFHQDPIANFVGVYRICAEWINFDRNLDLTTGLFSVLNVMKIYGENDIHFFLNEVFPRSFRFRMVLPYYKNKSIYEFSKDIVYSDLFNALLLEQQHLSHQSKHIIYSEVKESANIPIIDLSVDIIQWKNTNILTFFKKIFKKKRLPILLENYEEWERRGESRLNKLNLDLDLLTVENYTIIRLLSRIILTIANSLRVYEHAYHCHKIVYAILENISNNLPGVDVSKIVVHDVQNNFIHNKLKRELNDLIFRDLPICVEGDLFFLFKSITPLLDELSTNLSSIDKLPLTILNYARFSMVVISILLIPFLDSNSNLFRRPHEFAIAQWGYLLMRYFEIANGFNFFKIFMTDDMFTVYNNIYMFLIDGDSSAPLFFISEVGRVLGG